MNREVGAILLVSGTTIGAGMLALPVTSGLSGFFPASLLFIAFWAVMYYSALLFLEVNLSLAKNHIDKEINMVSMAKFTLGKWGEAVTWTVYLFLLYALTAAYLAGSAPLFIQLGETLFGWRMPSFLAPFPLVLLFGYFVMSGTASVDKINRWLMVGLFVTFTAIFFSMGPYFQGDLLLRTQFSELPLALSMAATSFGFHIVIPTLCSYLHKDVYKIKRALFWGSFLPLVVYIAWEALALGIIPPDGEYGLLAGYLRGEGAFLLLGEVIGRQDIQFLASCFAFFSIVTSFLGVSLSLAGFLADGIHARGIKAPTWTVDALTFIPPLLFVLLEPRAFFMALDYAGAYGVIVLLLIIPVLMAVSIRKKNEADISAPSYRAPGGKGALLVALIFSIIVISNQLYLQWTGQL